MRHTIHKTLSGSFADRRCTATQAKKPPTFSTAGSAVGTARRRGVPRF